MKMIYQVNDRPKFGQMLVFALQQLLAILAATIAVPAAINSNDAVKAMIAQGGAPMSQSAALFGAGVGTIVYLLFTKFRSPVFLGSSFAFIGSMVTAFAGATGSMLLGYAGLIIGAFFAGIVYVLIAIIVKLVGVKWINKIMPPVVIGPTVAIIGLSLAGNAVGDAVGVAKNANGSFDMTLESSLRLICALVTLLVVTLCSVYGKKMTKLIPFVIGIAAGYVVATVFTVIGQNTGIEAMQIIDFSKFQSMQWYPDFTFVEGLKGVGKISGSYIVTIAVAYVPVAFVVFAEHIADHKNLSSIIEKDLLEDPGLDRTLLGDGVGSMVGAIFGGCPNTTYGESVGCVAITGNASVATILATAIMAIVASFIAPFVTLLATIPSCVMGGVCISLYGFIAVSGLKMLQKVDLDKNNNLFVASVILIAGIGGMALQFGKVTVTSIATALILGIIFNVILAKGKNTDGEDDAQ